MCDPVSIAVASFVSSMAQADAASKAQDAAYEENLRASNQAKMDADRQMNLQQAQAEEAAAQEKISNDLQSREVLARAVVAGGESGAQGQSNLEVQQGIVRQGLEANNMVTQNLGRELEQLNEERLGVKSRTQSRINSVSKGAGIGLGTVIGAAANAGSTYLNASAAKQSLSINKAGGTV
jgi:mannitol-specific phosphotransferase system IIBC component